MCSSTESRQTFSLWLAIQMTPEAAWHMKEFAGGVLVSDPMVSDRTFIPKAQLAEYEDLEFVSRATDA